MSSSRVPRSRNLLWIFLVGLVLRLVVSFGASEASLLSVDGPDYREIAENLAHGRGYSISTYRWFEPRPPEPGGLERDSAVADAVDHTLQPEAGPGPELRPETRTERPEPRAELRPELCRPPLLPLTGAFYAWLPGPWLLHARIAAALTGALAILIVYGVARAAFGRPTAEIAAALFAIYPYAVLYSARWSTESVALLAVWTTVLLYLRRSLGARTGALLLGATLGLAALARPNLLPVGLAVLLLAVWDPAWRETTAPAAARDSHAPHAPHATTGRLVAARRAGLALVAMLVVLAPWTARNTLVTGMPNPTTYFGPYNMWLGYNDAVYQMYLHPFSPEFLTQQERQYAVLSKERVRTLEARSVFDIREVNRFWTSETLAFWREEPRKAVSILLFRAGHYFQPIPTPAVASRMQLSISALTVIPLMALAIFTLFRDRRARRPLFAVVVLAGLLAALPFTFSIRMRYPILDPLLVILGARGLCILIGRGWSVKREDGA